MDSNPQHTTSQDGAQPQADDCGGNGFINIKEAMQESSPDRLEEHVKTVRHLLGDLLPHLENQPGMVRGTSQFSKRIRELRQQSQGTKFVVLFRGKTGVGKSSTITTLCGEEKLLPTNCMRACTAVATETSWNDSSDPAETYRAEVEFISQADWIQELQCLFNDIITDGVVSAQTWNRDSPEGIAWAKISTVYPHYKPEHLTKTSAQNLASHCSISTMLGTTVKIQATSGAELNIKIQTYVDSMPNTPAEDTLAQANNKTTPSQLWPLIKVVRVYVKSELLKTGMVLVDLPGCGDSNAARSAVAQNYEKQANATWVVAPINRAVNDQDAHEILADSVKLQLQLEGTYSSVTFICSQTDNLEVEEVATDLRLKYEEYKLELEKLRKQHEATINEHSSLVASCEELKVNSDTLGREHRLWIQLGRQLKMGKKVFPPAVRTKKRAHTGAQTNGRKKPRIDGQYSDGSENDCLVQSSEDDDIEGDELDDIDFTDHDHHESLESLTSEQIESKEVQLEQEISSANAQIKDITQKIRALSKAKKASSMKMSEHKTEFKALCIRKRNNYARDNMQKIFLNGLIMRDQDEAKNADATSSNPPQGWSKLTAQGARKCSIFFSTTL